MSKHNRTFYLVRWECNTSDDWCIVGTYYYKDTAIEKAKHFQEVNTDGKVYIETVILPAR